VPTSITFDNEGSEIYTIIEVDTRDRPGLLHDLTRTLANANVYIASAVIATYGEQVVDTFYVKDMFGLKFHSEAKQKALDKKLREDMQLELVRLQHEVGITFVMVTHDQEEALSMADRIAVMDQGRVLQTADPRSLYENPTHRFVADFIGTMNTFEVEVRGLAEAHARVFHPLLGEVEVARAAPEIRDGVVIVRPEKLRLDFSVPPVEGEVLVDAEIEQIAYYGDLSFVFVRLDDGTRLQVSRYNVNRVDRGDPPAGTRCRIGVHPEDLLLVAAD